MKQKDFGTHIVKPIMEGLMKGVSKYSHKIPALAVLAKIEKMRCYKYQTGCGECRRIAHGEGWHLRCCDGIGEGHWYITHHMHGSYSFGEDFTWPIL